MSPIFRNILAVIAGILVGGIVNSAIITLGTNLIPLPEGVDPNDLASVNANIHLYSPKHFVIPYLAHAMGSLFGGFIAARIGATRQLALAVGVGFFFLIGGVIMSFMIPEAPLWFKAVDLLGAYLPIAYLGGKIAGGNRPLPRIIRGDILDQS